MLQQSMQQVDPELEITVAGACSAAEKGFDEDGSFKSVDVHSFLYRLLWQ